MLIIENDKEGRSCNLNTIQTIEGEIISSISQPVELYCGYVEALDQFLLEMILRYHSC